MPEPTRLIPADEWPEILRGREEQGLPAWVCDVPSIRDIQRNVVEAAVARICEEHPECDCAIDDAQLVRQLIPKNPAPTAGDTKTQEERSENTADAAKHDASTSTAP